jgi:hypothetical protein
VIGNPGLPHCRPAPSTGFFACEPTPCDLRNSSPRGHSVASERT